MERNILTINVNKQVAAVYLDRSRIQVYAKHLPAPITLDLPETIAVDLAIVDQSKATSLIKEWLEKSPISASDFAVILADSVYFSKELTATDPSGIEGDAAAFVEEVPFEETVSKIYTAAGHKVIIAVNRSFLDTILFSFGSAGWSLSTVVPLFLLGPESGKRWMDVALGKHVIDAADTLKSFSLLATGEYQGETTSTTSQHISPRLFFLGGVLVILILTLLILLRG